jgi:hypothetical protein
MNGLVLALALAGCGADAPARPNVILITLDGVRAREVFHGPDPVLNRGRAPDLAPAMPRLWASLPEGGFLAGDEARGDPFLTRNFPVCSLPGYQSILAGRDLGCWDNECPRTRVETVLERARRELGLERREVAVFAGWPKIARAVERVEGALTVNVGFEPFVDPADPDDPLFADVGRRQLADRPPWSHRFDRYTWALAMRYLERHRPRVLYIGLGDPDEWGHKGDYGAYLESLREFDAWLAQLKDRLAAMGEYGQSTSILVTADHGRGDGAGWRKHGVLYRGSDRTWLYARTPATCRAVIRSAGGPYDHLHVRPTIEALLGLEPCAGCRRPIAEVLPPAAEAVRVARPQPRMPAGG